MVIKQHYTISFGGRSIGRRKVSVLFLNTINIIFLMGSLIALHHGVFSSFADYWGRPQLHGHMVGMEEKASSKE